MLRSSGDPSTQGERELAGDNKSLARFISRDRDAPRGIPRSRCPSTSMERIVNVKARDKATGREHTHHHASSGLSKDEVSRLVKDAEMHAEDDRATARRRGPESGRHDGLLHRETLQDSATRSQRTRRRTSRRSSRRFAMPSDDDAERIKSATEALRTSSMKIGEIVYQKEQAKQQAEQPPQPGASSMKASPRAPAQSATETPSKASSRSRTSPLMGTRGESRAVFVHA